MIGETVSHYKILERIGGGSMGIVYEARDTRLNRNVALKFLPPAFTKDSEAKQRFIHEARAASSLDHPNIYTIHEIDETNDGRLFICMTRYGGKSLKDILSEHTLSLHEAVDIAIQIARGLAKAHKNDIVHQDIKPANILITEDGIAKIVDFGIARMTGQNISQTGSMMGTAAYMSPEQASGEMVDARSDVWSLGVVLYEMLTGGLPFQGQYEQAIIYSILNQDPEQVNQLRPEVSDELARIVHRALRKNPLERYQQVDEMLEDLMALFQGATAGHLSGSLVGEEKQVSLTILPFFNLSGKKDQDYFCEGFAEDLQRSLSVCENIHASPFHESMKLRNEHEDIRDISKHVNTEFILEGAIRKSEASVRITTQLINVQDGTNVWAERYEAPVADVLGLRSEIITNLMNTLDIAAGEAELEKVNEKTTDSVEAFDEYLQGLQAFRKFSERSLQEARASFLSAIESDAHFLRARELLLLTYFEQYLILENVNPINLFQTMRQYGDDHTENSDVCKSLILFPELFQADKRTEAGKKLKELSRQNPGNKYIQICAALAQFSDGFTEQSLQIAKQAAESDTGDYFFTLLSGMIAYYAGQLKYAESTITHSISLDPSVPAGHIWLGYVHLANSNPKEALHELELALSYSGESPLSRAAMAFYHASRGDSEQAVQIVRDLHDNQDEQFVSSFYPARIFAELGYTEEAMAALKTCVQQQEPGTLFMKQDPALQQLRSTAEFQELIEDAVPHTDDSAGFS